MNRRLYFLLPDVAHAQSVVRELRTAGVTAGHVHALSRKGVDLQDLPQASDRQRNDFSARLETALWNANLLVFFGALLVMVALAYLQAGWYWLLLPAAVMLTTFLLGEEFTRRIPDVHLAEFQDALRHGEILLMVDVPASKVERVESMVHKRHPEAVTGGVGWHVEALHA
jgi:hypothetical protein